MHDALLAALDENPDDLATWDVLADWLEERGDPRAEFMRLTRDTEFPNPALPAEQQARLREAHARAQTAWFPGAKLPRWGLMWKHGFVSRVLAAFTPSWNAQAWGDAPALHGHPALRFVRELNVTEMNVFRPMSLPHLRVLRCSGLRAVGLDDVDLPPLELAVLVRSETSWPARLPAPKHLFVTHDKLGDGRAPTPSTRELTSVVPNRFEFREHAARPDGPPDIRACGACQSHQLQVLQRASSDHEDRFGTFRRYYEEVWCLRCGAFTAREHDV